MLIRTLQIRSLFNGTLMERALWSISQMSLLKRFCLATSNITIFRVLWDSWTCITSTSHVTQKIASVSDMKISSKARKICWPSSQKRKRKETKRRPCPEEKTSPMLPLTWLDWTMGSTVYMVCLNWLTIQISWMKLRCSPKLWTSIHSSWKAITSIMQITRISGSSSLRARQLCPHRIRGRA